MLINGLGLDGAADGITAYIGNWDMSQLGIGSIWTRAIMQIFFSIGITFGIMTSYASYNDRHQSAVQDACIVAIANSLFSFVAGFGVYTVLGYLSLKEGIPISEVSTGGVALAFEVYPKGLGLIGAGDGEDMGNAWGQIMCILFFLTLFLLGIDSAFSMAEAVITAVHDSTKFHEVPREHVALVVCCLGVCISAIYCTDGGVSLLDVVDYWINNLAMLIVGLMECTAGG
jgi:SNF family Na+-dependent transporter